VWTGPRRLALRQRSEDGFIERPDQVEHHRWFPPKDEKNRGLVPLDGPTRAMLHQLRWRKTPRDKRLLWVALTIALVLHAIFVAILWYEMKPHAREFAAVYAPERAIEVRFVSRSSHVPVAPPPVTPPPPPLRPSNEPPSKNAIAVRLPEQPAPPPATSAPTPPTPPVLFDRSGRIILPANAASAPPAPTPDYVQRGPQGDTQIMHDKDTVKYKPTQLDQYWRKNSNAVDDALQKLVDKTTVTKTINLPKGIRIHCGVSIAALSGGCNGDPPPPPPTTDGDERLNMAPAALVKNAPPPPPPSVATCIAYYRAGKPLPNGCPVDTPARAVDAQKASSTPGQ
jgi:hypothetical protein